MRLRELLLSKLQEAGETTLDAFFPRKYAEARLWRSLLGLDQRYRFSRRSFSSILSQLRRQGLVERRGEGRGVWRLTALGLSRSNAKKPHAQDFRRLVIFDIPEKERHKRDIIRTELIMAGYTQFQKSVWVGQKPLPQGFLELIESFGLVNRVHIFSIRDAGTLPIRSL